MIIIDHNAAPLLAQALRKIKEQGQPARCVYFNLKRMPENAALKEKILLSAKQHVASVDTQMFLCGDGDIFILAPTMHTKNGREFIVEIADYLGMPASDAWVIFVELPLQINTLLVEAEAKCERIWQAEEAKKKQSEQEQAERKRRTILSGGTAKQHDIQHKRATRKTLELMIIEDDAFSRRLVENVLQKKYPLTGIGEVTYALDTYANLAPDLLFLDINLPDVTGHELLEKIIALDPEAYVVMLSGNADRENIVQAMSKGAKGFVAKPFTKDKLFQYIDRCPTIALKQQPVHTS